MNKHISSASLKSSLADTSKYIASLLLICSLLVVPIAAQASLNPFSADFKLSACDGPTLPSTATKPANYVACDFAGLMTQVQTLIEAMIAVGVLLTVASFSYAGYLYITGVPGNINKAKDIFKKVGIGFIMMLTAWFVVSQILTWFAANPGVKTLLGS